MRVLKRRYIARAVICLAILCISVSVVADQKQDRDYETAKTMYLQAYSMTTRAKEFRDERDWTEALKLYSAANDIYMLLGDKYPDWKAEVVANLNQECKMQIAFIRNMLDQKKVAATETKPVVEPASVETPPEPEVKVEMESPGADERKAASQRLRKEFDRLMREKNDLQRMIRRMQKEQEQALASQEREHEEQVAELRKESEALRKELAAIDRGGKVDPKQTVNRSIVDLTEENLSLNEQLTEALETIRKLRAKSIGFAKLAENYEQLRSENESMREREKEGYGKLIE